MVVKVSDAADAAAQSNEFSRADDRAFSARAAKGNIQLNPIPNKKPEPAAKKPEFERSLARLEEIVRKLENTNLSLDEAMKLFEEGVVLSRDCQKQLEQAEGRVEILMKKAGGDLTVEPFEPGSDEED
jgi:exodeoxyribonuclease VII small subunit